MILKVLGILGILFIIAVFGLILYASIRLVIAAYRKEPYFIDDDWNMTDDDWNMTDEDIEKILEGEIDND